MIRPSHAGLVVASALGLVLAAPAGARRVPHYADTEAGFGFTLGGFNALDPGFREIYGAPLAFSARLRWAHESGLGIQAEAGAVHQDGVPRTAFGDKNSYFEHGSATNFSTDYRFYSKYYVSSGGTPRWSGVRTSVSMYPLSLSMRHNFLYGDFVSPYVGGGLGFITYVEIFEGLYVDSSGATSNAEWTTVQHRDTAVESHVFGGVEFFTWRRARMYLELRGTYASARSAVVVYPGDVDDPGNPRPDPRPINLGGASLRIGMDLMF